MQVGAGGLHAPVLVVTAIAAAVVAAVATAPAVATAVAAAARLAVAARACKRKQRWEGPRVLSAQGR